MFANFRIVSGKFPSAFYNVFHCDVFNQTVFSMTLSGIDWRMHYFVVFSSVGAETVELVHYIASVSMTSSVCTLGIYTLIAQTSKEVKYNQKHNRS